MVTIYSTPLQVLFYVHGLVQHTNNLNAFVPWEIKDDVRLIFEVTQSRC